MKNYDQDLERDDTYERLAETHYAEPSQEIQESTPLLSKERFNKMQLLIGDIQDWLNEDEEGRLGNPTGSTETMIRKEFGNRLEKLGFFSFTELNNHFQAILDKKILIFKSIQRALNEIQTTEEGTEVIVARKYSNELTKAGVKDFHQLYEEVYPFLEAKAA